MPSENEIVYVIGAPHAGTVKIGRTTNIRSRLASIQTGCPTKVDVLWQTDGGSTLERSLHFEFRHFRTHGEWFDFGDADPVALVSAAASRATEQTRRSGPAGNTPLRNVRVADALWNAAMAKARDEGTTLTRVIVSFLEQYNEMTPTERREAAGLE